MDKKNNIKDYSYEIKEWLCFNKDINPNTLDEVKSFLTKLNDFDLDDYIKVIHFDELKVPPSIISLPKTKNYYGIKEMRQGELDFFKSIILSKKVKEVFMCNDMPMDDMAKDINFGKKWMFAVALMLKKGINLKIIHNLDRPFHELMIGLESWIPIYMTGQVDPFYFKNYNDKIYSHLTYVSDASALSGESICGNHSKGKYYLTNNKKEVEYYLDKAKMLKNKATPLMNIVSDKNMYELDLFYNKDILLNSNRKRLLSSLPIHTISEKLLDSILLNNNVNNKDKIIIKNEVNKIKENIKNITKDNILIDEITELNKDDFDKSNITLNILNYSLNYTYDNYLNHLKESKKYKNKNYKLIINNKLAFNNIDIYINEDKYVVISKRLHPHIHFIIEHPKLVNAIKEFTPLIIE